IYANDAPEGADDATRERALTPYAVIEQNFEVRRLQPSRGPERYGVCFAHPREAVTIASERNPDDPRVSHALTLEVDDYGNVTRSATITYGRVSTAAGVQSEQTRAWATLTEASFINEAPVVGWYRLGVGYEQRTYELTGLDTIVADAAGLPRAGQGLLDYETLRSALPSAIELPYETPGDGAQLQRRLVERQQQTF